jgi:hypothetical protein
MCLCSGLVVWKKREFVFAPACVTIQEQAPEYIAILPKVKYTRSGCPTCSRTIPSYAGRLSLNETVEPF